MSEHCRPSHLTTVIHSFLLNTSWIGFNGSQSVSTQIDLKVAILTEAPAICQKRSVHQLFMLPTYVVLIHQRYGQTDGRTPCDRNASEMLQFFDAAKVNFIHYVICRPLGTTL